MKHAFIALSATLALAACANDAANDSPKGGRITQEEGYRQCLRDRQMVAMAWEEIERQCREETGYKGTLDDDDEG